MFLLNVVKVSDKEVNAYKKGDGLIIWGGP